MRSEGYESYNSHLVTHLTGGRLANERDFRSLIDHSQTRVEQDRPRGSLVGSCGGESDGTVKRGIVTPYPLSIPAPDHPNPSVRIGDPE